jgi:U3 small nucleolar RNA-associated protein 22
LHIPFTEPSPLDAKGEEPKWKLGWEKPAEVFVCGSWSVLGGYKKGRREVSTKDGKGKHEVEVGSIDLGVLMPDVSDVPGLGLVAWRVCSSSRLLVE